MPDLFDFFFIAWWKYLPKRPHQCIPIKHGMKDKVMNALIFPKVFTTTWIIYGTQIFWCKHDSDNYHSDVSLVWYRKNVNYFRWTQARRRIEFGRGSSGVTRWQIRSVKDPMTSRIFLLGSDSITGTREKDFSGELLLYISSWRHVLELYSFPW